MSQVTHNVFGSVGTASAQEKQADPNVDLKSLIELGCIRDSKKIGDMTFYLKTLNLVDRVRLTSTLTPDSTREEFVDFQINLLASAIENIDGKTLESLHPDQTMDPFKRKVDIVAAFQSPVTNALMRLYDEMLKRCDAQYDLEQIKK